MAGWLIVVSTRGWISVGPGPISVRCGGWNDVIFLVEAICVRVMGMRGAASARAWWLRGTGKRQEMDGRGFGLTAGFDVCEVVERAVQQVRRRDIGERAEDGFEAAGLLLLPLVQHGLYLLPLQLLLGAAQVAGNDGKFAQLRVRLQVRLVDVGERADHDVLAVVGNELGRHGLQLPAVETVEEERLWDVAAMVAERDPGGAQLARHAVEHAAA